MNYLSSFDQITTYLTDMNIRQGFPISVVSDAQGFTIAWAAGSEIDSERQSAAGAIIQKATSRAIEQLGMANTDEISLYDDHQHFVCRPFSLGDRHYILAVMISNKGQSYRRVTNHAVHDIRQIMKKTQDQ